MLRSETAQDPARLQRALAGLRLYQEAVRQPVATPMPAIAEVHGASLRDYSASPEPGHRSGAPVLFVPSLINPPNILDLGGERSLLRWLADRGHRVLLVDWGWDVARRRALSVGGHVEDVLLPMIRGLDAPPALVGYCLGGTMATAAATLTEVRGLVTIAAPWRFSAYEPAARSLLARLWSEARPTVERLGLLPMELLQSAFWSLDPGRTVSKFERFAELPDDAPEARDFVLLEDWANDGPPIGEAAARELFEDFFAADVSGSGGWTVGGRTIDPGVLPCPRLEIVSTSDRIVPAASAAGAGERLALAQGHVGMVIGRRARETLWEPLEAWLSGARPTC